MRYSAMSYGTYRTLHRSTIGRPMMRQDTLPVNMPDPIRIGPEALARSGPDDSCTSACFRTGTVQPKPDAVSQNQIGSELVLYNLIRAVCGRA